MAPLLFDRVKESTTTSGTGGIALGGAETGGFQTFSAVLSDGQMCYYCIQDTPNSAWEVGVGTYNAGTNTLTRTTVLASSNSGALVNFASGTKDVFIDYPAGRAITQDNLSSFLLPGPAPPTSGWTLYTGNGGSGRVTTVGSSINLFTTPAGINTHYNTFYYRVYPTPPFTLTAYIVPNTFGLFATNWGLVLYNSVNGLSVHDQWLWLSTGFNAVKRIAKWSGSGATFSADYNTFGTASTEFYFPQNMIYWFRIVDDGTHRAHYVSADGQTWIQSLQVLNTDYLTPNQIGIFFDPYISGAGNPLVETSIILTSWTGVP